jgi:hypothetical protein
MLGLVQDRRLRTFGQDRVTNIMLATLAKLLEGPPP